MGWDGLAVDTVVDRVIANSVPWKGPRMPWDAGIVGAVLGTRPLIDLMPAASWTGRVPQLPRERPGADARADAALALAVPTTATRLRKISLEGDAWQVAVKRKKSDLEPDEAERVERGRLLERWTGIVAMLGDNTTTGRRHRSLEGSGEWAGAVLQELEVLMAHKRNGTMSLRAGSVQKILDWGVGRGLDFREVELDETVFWEYVSFLWVERAPATRAQVARASIGFLKGTTGLESADSILGSRRISGQVRRSLTTKAPDTQKDPLKVSMLLEFHRAVHDESLHFIDRLYAGHASWLTGARLRGTEGQDVAGEPVLDIFGEEGFVETGVLATKTSNRDRKISRILPAVAHARGLDGRNWARAWLAVRREHGLDSGRHRKVLTPAWDSERGRWTRRRLENDELACWMVAFLTRRGFDKGALENLGTHSCKATMLSWCAKAYVKRSARRLLGYHVEVGDRSMLEYSRDAQAGPLRELEMVLDAIREGRFLPDATRSGRWIQGHRSEAPGTPPAEARPPTPSPPRSAVAGAPTPSPSRSPAREAIDDLLESEVQLEDSLAQEVRDGASSLPSLGARESARGAEAGADSGTDDGFRDAEAEAREAAAVRAAPSEVPGPADAEAGEASEDTELEQEDSLVSDSPAGELEGYRDAEESPDERPACDGSAGQLEVHEDRRARALEAEEPTDDRPARRRRTAVAASPRYWEFIPTGRIHMEHAFDAEMLACGRWITERHRALDVEEIDWGKAALCGTCFGT